MTRRLRFLISAGPTREFLDPVRYLSNPSSGKMGIALARAAAGMGHDVCLVHGPCEAAIPSSPRVKAIAVTTALQMQEALRRAFARCDVLIMAAAVTDFRAMSPRRQKMKKSERGACTLRLRPNPDILWGLSRDKRPGQIVIGFAAETQDLLRHARQKLQKKDLDFIVANPVRGGQSAFGSETNRAALLDRGGVVLKFPRMKKATLAQKLVRRFARIALASSSLFS